MVIIGHTRLRAALELGLQEVPVHVATELDPTKVKALRLADNRTGEEAEWDELKLIAEVTAIDCDEIPGFDNSELLEMLQAGKAKHESVEPSSINSDRLGKSRVKIKIVLSTDYVDIFEAAMEKTGICNRMEALREICEVYLEKR